MTDHAGVESPVPDLPDDMVKLIMTMLPPEDCGRLRGASKYTRRLVDTAPAGTPAAVARQVVETGGHPALRTVYTQETLDAYASGAAPLDLVLGGGHWMGEGPVIARDELAGELRLWGGADGQALAELRKGSVTACSGAVITKVRGGFATVEDGAAVIRHEGGSCEVKPGGTLGTIDGGYAIVADATAGCMESGQVYLFGGSRIGSVSGGAVHAGATARISEVSGGFVELWQQSVIDRATGGQIKLHESSVLHQAAGMVVIEARGSSVVHAWEDATLTVYASADVHAHDRVAVVAYGGTVHLYGDGVHFTDRSDGAVTVVREA
ncbi:F-box protein [Streptomyces sp. NPDC056519]|uniref:F-box protein n=1 Tax=Streptomyces sp. NPDC056519 TaxID=3345849 RepID=UPI003692DD6B